MYPILNNSLLSCRCGHVRVLSLALNSLLRSSTTSQRMAYQSIVNRNQTHNNINEKLSLLHTQRLIGGFYGQNDSKTAVLRFFKRNSSDKASESDKAPESSKASESDKGPESDTVSVKESDKESDKDSGKESGKDSGKDSEHTGHNNKLIQYLRSLGLKALPVIWLAAGLLIAAVCYIEVTFNHDEELVKSRREQRRQRREARHGQSQMEYYLAKPCMRNSCMMAIISSVTGFAATFLFTSNIRKANVAMLITPVVVFISYYTFCYINHTASLKEHEEFQSMFDEMQRRKYDEGSIKLNPKSDDK